MVAHHSANGFYSVSSGAQWNWAVELGCWNWWNWAVDTAIVLIFNVQSF